VKRPIIVAGQQRRASRKGHPASMWWLLGVIAAVSAAVGLVATRQLGDPLVGMMASGMIGLVLLAVLHAAGVRYDA
jgi:drug/metabolite transporter (DMT)-like permease